VPHHLRGDLGVVRIELRERRAEAVLGRLAGGRVDERAVLVELELPLVRLARLVVAIVEGVVARLDRADRRGELPVLVVLEDLRSEEILPLLPRALVELLACLELGTRWRPEHEGESDDRRDATHVVHVRGRYPP